MAKVEYGWRQGPHASALGEGRDEAAAPHASQFAAELREEERKTLWHLHSQQEENVRCPGH